MRFTRLIPLVIALFCLTLSPAAADELFSLKLGFQSLSPDGDLAVKSGSLAGTTADLGDDLGLGDSSEVTVEAAVQLGAFRLSAAYLPVNFSGNSVLTRDIDYNGETFVSGSHVKSNVELNIYEAGVAWYLVNVDDLPVRLQIGPELAIKYVDAFVDLKDDTLGQGESESVNVPVPTAGLRGRLAIGDAFGLVGRIGYMEYEQSSLLDIDAQIEFSPLPMVGLYAGYRYLDIDLDEGDVSLDASFAGPYMGALFRF